MNFFKKIKFRKERLVDLIMFLLFVAAMAILVMVL
jgi:hypothetical protein